MFHQRSSNISIIMKALPFLCKIPCFNKVIAFANLFDQAFALRSLMEHAMNRSAPMHLMTDSRSLFYILSKVSRTSEKRVTLDIHTTRLVYQAHETSNIGFVCLSDSLADGSKNPRCKRPSSIYLQPHHTHLCVSNGFFATI